MHGGSEKMGKGLARLGKAFWRRQALNCVLKDE